MLTDADRQDAMAALGRTTETLKKMSPEVTENAQQPTSDVKGTGDIKSIIESFHSGNIFVVPEKKPDPVSMDERKKLAEAALTGLQNIKWR